MNYEEKYKQAIDRAKGLLEGMDEGDYLASSEDIENIFPELKKSEDEWIRKRIIHSLGGDVLDMEETIKAIAWLEKQGENKKLDPDKVIAWLVANICDFEYYVKLFKKDFKL